MPTDTALEEKATQESIVSIRYWNDDLFTFQTTRPRHYSFIPGQYSRLGLVDGNSMVWRPYSITSAPLDEHLEYYGVRVPGGAFTGLFTGLQPGSPIWIERARYGFMTVDRFADGEHLWLLATGTGLGPFVSILRDGAVWNRFRHIVLAHGCKFVGDLSYRDELLDLQQTPPSTSSEPAQLHLLKAVTRASDVPEGCLHGRLTALLESGGLEREAGLQLTPEQSRVMMCGNPAMIEDVRRLLHLRGMRPCRRLLPGQFVTENYW